MTRRWTQVLREGKQYQVEYMINKNVDIKFRMLPSDTNSSPVVVSIQW